MPRFTVFLLVAAALRLTASAAFVSPAKQRIAAAEKVVAANPKSAPAYLELATGYSRLARETGDAGILDQAEKSLKRCPCDLSGNYDAQKLRVTIALARHDYAHALDLAKELNQRAPDDIPVWGFLVEANMALGNYSEAEKQAQWMLDLLPGNGPGFSRAAELRELYGDLAGAIEFTTEAFRRVPENDVSDRAELLAQNAHRQLLGGNPDGARETLGRAADLFPENPAVLLGMAQLRTVEKKYAEAAELLERRHQVMKSSASLYDWAEALQRDGRKKEADSAFDRFLSKATAESSQTDNANLDLIFYYADHAQLPAQAVKVAEREIAARHDVYTRDAYAWALYRNREFEKAKIQSSQALSIGTLEPEFFCHASQIAAALGDEPTANKMRLKAAVMPDSCAAIASDIQRSAQ